MKQIYILMGVFVALVMLFTGLLSYQVQQAGGISQIIIDTGKEVNHIKQEINKE